MAGSPLAPIPGSPAMPTSSLVNPDTVAAPNPTSTLSRGPRPGPGEYALPIPEQIRALLQSRLAVTLTDGRELRGTLTSVDSTSVLMSNVEELREVTSENVRRYWPWSKDGINAGYDGDVEGRGAGASAAGVGRESDLQEGEEVGQGGEEGAEGGAEEEKKIGGGGPGATIRRRELQSILVQFAHCKSIELDEENHAAWRRYCEMPEEMRPNAPSQPYLGQVI